MIPNHQRIIVQLALLPITHFLQKFLYLPKPFKNNYCKKLYKTLHVMQTVTS